MNTNHSPNGQPRADDAAAKVTAYALGQLSEAESAEVEALLADSAQDALRRHVQEVRQLTPALLEARGEDSVAPRAELRKAVERKLGELAPSPAKSSVRGKATWAALVGGGCVIAGLLAVLYSPAPQFLARTWLAAPREVAGLNTAMSQPAVEYDSLSTDPSDRYVHDRWVANGDRSTPDDMIKMFKEGGQPTTAPESIELQVDNDLSTANTSKKDHYQTIGTQAGTGLSGRGAVQREAVAKGYYGSGGETQNVAKTWQVPRRGDALSAEGQVKRLDELQKPEQRVQAAASVTAPAKSPEVKGEATLVTPRIIIHEEAETSLGLSVASGEQYELPPENAFRSVRDVPLSTFSIDVDTASYANVRRFLNSGRLPPPAAVRIEEMVNYFSYRYPQPMGDDPFSVNLESAECPWQPGHLLLRVGLKGKDVHRAERPASNLVFLVDVSGSMADENKLPLLKTSLAMMAGELQRSDRVSMVVYAGDAGTKLDSVRGDEKDAIRRVIDSLSAGGSTHGSAGIQAAYDLAKKNFITGGVNRVIWATDGDLNVGITDDNSLVTLIKEKAASGVFLTVLGVGEGNLKDAKLERLADNGNGMYAYLDSVKEARKVLIDQMSGSLVTIAKDVKLQIEFNPAEVAAYRLIGYENRILAARDFADDKKDAGEIGAGHTVTALYELVPAGGNADKPAGPESELKYQKFSKPVATEKPAAGELSDAAKSGELLTLKLRFKQPDAERSVLREFPLKEKGGRFGSATPDFQFAAAVAQFGMLLRGSQHRGSSAYSNVSETAAATIGDDPQGLRAEFVDLVRKAERMGK